LAERPYSRYTRAKTWVALYSQHLTAGYALVPYSATNNSIAVISCLDARNAHQDLAKGTQDMTNQLLQHAEECAVYYSSRQTPDQAPAILAKARQAVVLAKSSDYYHYHLEDHPEFKLVICGMHDSYLHLPVWEMRTNQRYKARETAIAIPSPDFNRIRCTQFGHSILVAAYAKGNQDAIAFVDTLPPRTQSRLKREKDKLQDQRYRGRPLAFLTEAEREEVGKKISAGLRRYHEQKREKAI
jgi:hypothetical protein